MTHGRVRVGRFSETDLRVLVDANRLERFFPDLAFDARRFSGFQWLVVEEELQLDPKPAARTWPLLFVPMPEPHEYGQIEPYKGRFPLAVENALFAVLLAPWEEWSTVPWDWRGFRVPWVYTVDEDIFVRPETPPSADTLAWDYHFFDDGYGGTDEAQAPREWPLNDGAQSGLAVFDDAYWSTVERALGPPRPPLFETPVAHFFVRAFLSEGIDEFLAHMTTIEAALGVIGDYKNKKNQPKHKHLKGASARVAARVAALLENGSAAADYNSLFDVRCDYVHGRGEMKALSAKQRTDARSLARRVAEALVRTNETSAPGSREEFLNSLLDRGALMLPGSGGPTGPPAS
jgi:hypothetical protein